MVEFSRLRMFADGTSLTMVNRSKCKLKKCLMKDLPRISEWVQCNRLRLNVNKTQFLVLTRRKRAIEVADGKVELDGELLTRSTEVKCLGVVIDDKLSWKAEINSTRRKAYGGLSKLKCLCNVLPTGLRRNCTMRWSYTTLSIAQWCGKSAQWS